ncbi:MAG TPA: hypothetical protein VLV88_06640 [Terriglobales bacterium]|nr:hypothetical protein [Terriglobales bacterium]
MYRANQLTLAVAAVIAFLFVTRPVGPIRTSATDQTARAVSQQANNNTVGGLKDHYKVIEIEKFEVQEGVSFSDDYIQRLQDETLKEFQKSGEFKQALLPGQSPEDATSAVLRVTGIITYFDPGSRGERYIGFGLGSGNIVANILFRDVATNQPLILEQVCATFAGGAFGGASEGITRELARRLRTALELHLEKPLPLVSESDSLSLEFLRHPAADDKFVSITKGAFEEAQTNLNQQAVLGYRVVVLTPHGTKSADVRMMQAATPPEVYQYRIFHVQNISNLAKDLTKAGLEGYRYRPRTLGQFGGAVGVAIAEKPPVLPAERYTYRLHAAMQISNAKKDIVKDQRESFSLAGTMEFGGMHVVLLEKAVTKSE